MQLHREYQEALRIAMSIARMIKNYCALNKLRRPCSSQSRANRQQVVFGEGRPLQAPPQRRAAESCEGLVAPSSIGKPGNMGSKGFVSLIDSSVN